MTMIVDLTEAANWPKEFDVVVEPRDIDLESSDTRLASRVKARGTVERHAAWFGVSGQIRGDIEIDCSRCLEPVKRPLSIPFAVRFIRAETEADARESEVDLSDLNSSEIEGDMLDLTEVIREQILLDLPEQVFCKEDCQGLCPKCGSNRNLIDCKCEESEIDPRWDALKDLK